MCLREWQEVTGDRVLVRHKVKSETLEAKCVLYFASSCRQKPHLGFIDICHNFDVLALFACLLAYC